MTAAIEYNPHCKRCNGTGCVYGVLYDPPEQCDCMFYYQPETTDTQPTITAHATEAIGSVHVGNVVDRGAGEIKEER